MPDIESTTSMILGHGAVTVALDEPGYVTRGQSGGRFHEEIHPGIDIAVPNGSMVRAAGGATVHQVGEDPEYGLFRAPPTCRRTIRRCTVTSLGSLVHPGASVVTGEVIGLSGNTGRSTAPHLHFEIRQRGVSLDP